MKIRKLNLGMFVLAIVSSTAITSCTSNGNADTSLKTNVSSPAISPTPRVPNITLEEFEAAKKQLKFKTDDFTGDLDISAGKTPILTDDKDSSLHATLGIHITNDVVTKEMTFFFTTHYSSDRWMLHNEVALKSSRGVFTLSIDKANRDDQVRDVGHVGGDFVMKLPNEIANDSDREISPGIISEFGVSTLHTNALDLFCKTVSGENLKVRLSGPGSSGPSATRFNAYVPKSKLLSSGCVLWYGLEQGLPPNF